MHKVITTANSCDQKVLVLPSWYPHPSDNVVRSFFQEQSKLVSDRFDVRLLFFRYRTRPSVGSFVNAPLRITLEWCRFIFQGKVINKLPDLEVFTDPPLIEYAIRIIGLTQRQRYRFRLNAYLEAVAELIASGWKPDLIHAHSVNMGGLAAKRIKEVFGIPYVITEHMPFAISNYPEYMRQDIKQAFLVADKVLSLGYDKVRQLGISDIDVEPNLIYNYVDEQVFNRLSTSYVPGDPLKLISIGAASYLKDHRTLLRSLVVLKERRIPFTLTMIGLKLWGSLYDETLSFIKASRLESHVTIIDLLDKDQICSFLSLHNVYLMTSLAEGLPVSVLEAMACGLFVIATRHGGTEDILTPESGTLVEIKNFKKIADRLEDIYFGRIKYNPSQIRDHVVSICGRDAFKNRLAKYYEDAISCAKKTDLK